MTTGETLSVLSAIKSLYRFNPHPSMTTGETVGETAVDAVESKFQPTPVDDDG